MQHLLADIWLEYRPTVIFVTHDISEAVFLGDDIYIMSASPAYIVKHYHIGLPLERHMDMKKTKEFFDYVGVIEDEMHRVGVLKQS